MGTKQAVAASYDSTGRYGAQTPFADQLSDFWVGGKFEVDSTHNSLITLTNAGKKPTDAVLTFHYNYGQDQYQLRTTIAAGDQSWVNVADLIHGRIPDAKGNTIPPDVTYGTYDVREPGRNGDPSLFEGKIIVDKTNGHLAYGCTTCCGDGYPGMVANPTILPVLVIDHVQVIATNSCTGYDDVLTDGFSGWGTSDSSIATMNSNQITGVGPGSTNAFASGTFNYNNGVSKYCTVKNSSPRNTTNVLSVTQSPQSLNMSSGDTNVPISVTIAGPSGTLAFSVGGSNNPNSSSHATVSIPGSSNPPAMGNYTMSVSGSNSPSGIFGAVACVTGVCASQGTTINIPPQILIQMMQAEAGGTNTTAMTADGDVVRNRFASSLFNPPYNTYQNTIVSGQFAFSSTANGVQPELNDAVNVFTGLSGNFCNALAFWTPTSTQWSNVQYAINNPSTTFPTGTGAPTYNQNTWPTSQQQILYVSSVGTQGNGAPNFLYLAQRNSTQNAAVSATCTP